MNNSIDKTKIIDDAIQTKKKITLATNLLEKASNHAKNYRDYTELPQNKLIEIIKDLENTVDRVIPALNYTSNVLLDSIIAKINEK